MYVHRRLLSVVVLVVLSVACSMMTARDDTVHVVLSMGIRRGLLVVR